VAGVVAGGGGASNAYAFLNVTTGHTIIAYFAIDRYPLTVTSLYGSPTPGVGTWTNDWGTELVCSNDATVVSGQTQHVNKGWTGTGSVPAVGAGNTVGIVQTNTSTITWRWGTNYWLATSGATATGRVDVSSGWYGAGSNVTVTAIPSNGYDFAGWSGDTNGCAITGSQITAPMSGPRSIGANFAMDEGNIRVYIFPADAVTAGARWRLTQDLAWQTNGAIVAGLSVTGTYAVTFNVLPGWTSPEDIQSIGVTVGATTTRSATYMRGDVVRIKGGTFLMGVDTNGSPQDRDRLDSA
jgi:hypothetical protein